MSTIDTQAEHAPVIEHAGGSWWAGCDCGWYAAQPLATETAATTEWTDHYHTTP